MKIRADTQGLVPITGTTGAKIMKPDQNVKKYVMLKLKMSTSKKGQFKNDKCGQIKKFNS